MSYVVSGRKDTIRFVLYIHDWRPQMNAGFSFRCSTELFRYAASRIMV